MKKPLQFLTTALLAGLFFATSVVPATAAPVMPPEISWEMTGAGSVRFQLHFSNPDPLEPTLPVSGEIHSQMFGVFLPDYGTIGTFNVPPIAANSFFDVFFDVPLDQLPQGGGGGGLVTSQALQVQCPPQEWAGNVDVFWNGPGGQGQVNYHKGDIGPCPGGAASCLHLVTGCMDNLTWIINNPCSPGWTATLENQDHTPAPAMLPPNWTGWLCVTADASIAVGDQCCFSVDFLCNGVTATVHACAFACSCETGTQKQTWGGIKNIYH
jgi:hypothetical protein